MFRSHSDAWSDIRQSMVWAFLGTENFDPEKKGWFNGVGEKERYWRAMVIQKLLRSFSRPLFERLMTFESGTNDEATLGPSSRTAGTIVERLLSSPV